MLRCRPGHAGVADMVLKDRVALVTGGGTGIGLAIALAFLREGARVTIGSRNPVHLKEGSEAARAAGHAVLTLQLDVTDPASVRSAVDAVVSRYGRIDILVNNAGASGRTPMTDPDDSRWHAIIQTNLTGAYLCSKQALRVMKDGEHGRIINLSSVLGRFGVPGYAAYCAAKHGIIGFTKAVALEVASRGITVNAICPSWVDTDMARQGITETAAGLGVSAEEFRRHAALLFSGHHSVFGPAGRKVGGHLETLVRRGRDWLLLSYPGSGVPDGRGGAYPLDVDARSAVVLLLGLGLVLPRRRAPVSCAHSRLLHPADGFHLPPLGRRLAQGDPGPGADLPQRVDARDVVPAGHRRLCGRVHRGPDVPDPRAHAQVQAPRRAVPQAAGS